MTNGKLNKVLLWNYVSLGIMAVVGLLMNALIVLYYDSDALGVFSETYAWYMILSQIAVWGIHMAVVKYVPETDCEKERGTIVRTAVMISIITALLVTVVSETVLYFMDGVAWKRSMQIAFLGLMLLSVNKILLNYLNAVDRMVTYAVFVSVRYLLLGLGIWFFSVIGVRPEWLAVVFPVTEIIVFLITLGYFMLRIPVGGKTDRKVFRKLLYFGTKILPSYMVLELNTKVDVVCLGILRSNVSQIGIYSFSIFFTEGFYMLYVTIRKMINPGIAAANNEKRLLEQITEIKKRLHRYVTLGGGAAYVGISIGYMIFCKLIQRPAYSVGVIYILIICLAIAINGRYIVFGDLLAQAGYPLEESILNVLTVAGNFILNLILIKIFGTIGAAAATAVSYFIFSFYMKIRVKERVGFTV